MKKNNLFEECLRNVPTEIKEEVSLNIDIANRIHYILHSRNIKQKDFALMMNKNEAEILRWFLARIVLQPLHWPKFPPYWASPLWWCRKNVKIS